MELRIVGLIVVLLCIWSITCIGVQAGDTQDRGKGNEHIDDSITTQSTAGNTDSTGVNPIPQPSKTSKLSTVPNPSTTTKPVPQPTKTPNPIPQHTKTPKPIPQHTKTPKPTTQPIQTPKSITHSTKTPKPTTQPTQTPKSITHSTKTPKPTTQPTQTTKSTKPTTVHKNPARTSKQTSQHTKTTTQNNDEMTSIYTSTTSLISTVNTSPENAPSATPATSVIDNKTSNKSHNDTSTTTLNSQTITTETYSQPFTGQGHNKSASTPAPVIMTTLSSTVSRPDKLITIHITEIFVDKNGKEQIELKILGNKAKLSHYSVHFFCGKTMSHYYNIQLSEDNVNEEGYLLMTDDHINLEQYLKRNGSVSLAVYYNKPNKVIMDNEGLVDVVVITTDHKHVPTNLPLHHGNFIITTKLSDIKNGFTAMRCSDSKAWKKGRQSTLGKPNPTCHSATNSDTTNKIKVTVAVVSTCLVIFFIIVIMVIVYMRRKQEGIRHFQLSPLSDDDDELILNMEHPSEEYTSGSEPTFDNDFYSKMRKL